MPTKKAQTTATKTVKKSTKSTTATKKVAKPAVKVVNTAAKAEPVAKATTKSAQIQDMQGFFLTASKQQIIDTFALKSGDTGSPEVQVALASHKIVHLASHLEQNPKDNHSRRGLLKVISKRRRILHYLQTKDQPRYEDVIKSLNLKK